MKIVLFLFLSMQMCVIVITLKQFIHVKTTQILWDMRTGIRVYSLYTLFIPIPILFYASIG